MRAGTALLVTLIPLVGVGGWLAGHTAGERWQASALPSGAEEKLDGWSPAPRIDLVVEYEPPVDGREVATRASPPQTHPAVPELAPLPVEANPTVMQRLLTLYEKIERSP
jgi:hypothetical protein